MIAWRLDVAHVNPRALATMTSAGGSNTRYSAGTVVRLPAVSGHRDTGYTACPGANLYPLLGSIRERAGDLGLPKIWNPRTNVTELDPAAPQILRVRARGSAVLTWSVVVLAPDGTVAADLGQTTGELLDLVWPKAGPPPRPTVPGTYAVVISATGPDGTLARSATVPLEVLPGPSPTPSP